MYAVLIRLLDERDKRKFNQNTIDNLTAFDDYIYRIVQE